MLFHVLLQSSPVFSLVHTTAEHWHVLKVLNQLPPRRKAMEVESKMKTHCFYRRCRKKIEASKTPYMQGELSSSSISIRSYQICL